MDQYMNIIAAIASLLGIVSFCANIIQYRQKRTEISALRTHAQDNYNAYFTIARACTRARDHQEDAHTLNEELFYVRGIADTQRNGIIAYSREHLSFIPFYEHPMYPGKTQPEEVLAGMAPDKLKRKEVYESRAAQGVVGRP